MSIKTLARSFAGGIIAPDLYGRLDLVKYQTGLAEALNFWVLPHGPVQNRPGFGYVLETKDSTKASRLIPFSYNTEQTFILEFGDQYIRWHTQGATLLEASQAITGITQPAGVITINAHGYSNGQWLYLAAIGGMTELNGRFIVVSDAAANTFRMKDFAGNYITTGSYGAYTSGGTASRVYEIATPFLEADLFDIHFVQSADVLTLTHPNYAPRELRRLGAANWQLSTISFVPTIATPGRPTLATSGSGGTPAVHTYVVTALAEGTLEESLASPLGSANAATNITAITQANPGVLTSTSHGLALNDKVYVSGIGGMVQITDDYYLVNSVPTANTFSLKTLAGVAIDTTAYSAYTSGGTVQKVNVSLDLTVAGNYIDITPAAVSGAVRYNVYKLSSGLYGFIGQTDGSAFRDNNITPDVSQTPPLVSNPFSGAGEYPGAVGYHEQRRCFAGSDNKPQNFWATRSATESSLEYSIPTRDDDSISLRIASREVNRIRHIVSLDQLLLLTSGGEWKIAPQNSDVLTPTTAAPKQFGAEGASNVQPAITSSSVIYVQESGSRLREMKYQWEANGYQVGDISIMAPHLFDEYTIVDLAYAKAPYKMIWCVRDDGRLLGLSYLPEHEVVAWHQHDTAGYFESVACVKEGSEYVLYALIRRTIDSRSVRYVERLHTRRFAAIEDAFFVDSGLSYDGSPVSSLGGLWHLEGEELAVLADGAEVTGLTVTDGQITLEHEASVVHAGLRITADLQTLPLSMEVQALGQGTTKNVDEVYLRLQDTSGISIGPTFEAEDMVEMTMRSGEPYGTPPALMNGIEQVTVMPQWGQDVQICIRQTAPLPATVLAMTLETSLGD